MRHGVDPDALVYRPVSWYVSQHHDPDAAKVCCCFDCSCT